MVLVIQVDRARVLLAHRHIRHRILLLCNSTRRMRG
jgi:hypothetical protein